MNFKHVNQAQLMVHYRAKYPYCVKTLEDGSEVMFNRDYYVIMGRTTDGKLCPPVIRAKMEPDMADLPTTYLYDDKTPPHRNSATRKRCEDLLKKWRGDDEA